MRMMAAIGAAALMLMLVCGGLLGALAGGATTAACGGLPAATPSLQAGLLTPPAGGYPPVGAWDSQAVGNAATIIRVGAGMGVPPRGWVIAVATAIQESSLINLPYLGDANNADSLGLFQQRPSQGWGTPAQIMDPVYASTLFYQHLLAVRGWQTMSLTDAAQAVQRSGTPDAYGRWEADATRIVAALTGVTDPSAIAGCDPSALAAVPSGFTLPPDTPPAVVTAIVWAFGQLGTPYAFGGDCTKAHGGDPAHQCDCSSLVQQAYKAGGISLPRTSQDQFHAGTPVPEFTQLRPGDLLFVPGAPPGTMTAPGHVGIYLGDGLVLDAPTTGQTVHIGPVQPYWFGSNLAGIRRVA